MASSQLTSNDDTNDPRSELLIQQNNILLDMKIRELRQENLDAHQRLQDCLQQIIESNRQIIMTGESCT